MDCSLPGSSAYGIFQARVLESGAITFSGKKYGLLFPSFSSTPACPLCFPLHFS